MAYADIAPTITSVRIIGVDLFTNIFCDFSIKNFFQINPQNVQRLKELMLSKHGFLISSPEYNSSISGVLKNTIDWTSRQSENETPLACYMGKVAGIMSASPGGLGGLRGLVHVRAILENMGVMVIPEQIAVSAAHEAFDADNSLKDKRQEEKVKKIGANLTNLLEKLS